LRKTNLKALSNPLSPLRLNVGFFLNQNIGYSRDFPFDIPKIHLPPDLDLELLTGAARITRTPQGLLMQVKAHASLPEECSRCLTSFGQPLDSEFTELYAFSAKSVTESNLLSPEDGHIDLEPLIREYMLLAIPINPLCRPDCKGLCPVCGENLNEYQHNHDTDDGDPRLSVLKTLLEKDKE
jgi:uncharacterized protein